MLKDRITLELKEAMKSGNSIKKNLLRVVLSEIDRSIDKNITLQDSDVEKVIIKMTKSAETIGSDESIEEINILSEFLPKAMSLKETEIIVLNLINKLNITSMKDMGKIMGSITKEYGNRLDKKLVSQIIKDKVS